MPYAPLTAEAKALLRACLSWKDSAWVFPNKTLRSQVDSYQLLQADFSTSGQESQIGGRHLAHLVRHTFASRLAMNGQSGGTIPTLLRHSVTALV